MVIVVFNEYDVRNFSSYNFGGTVQFSQYNNCQ
jgi:hypothetical protein